MITQFKKAQQERDVNRWQLNPILETQEVFEGGLDGADAEDQPQYNAPKSNKKIQDNLEEEQEEDPWKRVKVDAEAQELARTAILESEDKAHFNRIKKLQIQAKQRGCYINPDVRNPGKRKETLNNWVSKMENSQDY